MKTILVTGASSGIGRTVAKMLLQQGCMVIGTSRDTSKFASHPLFTPVQIDFADTAKITAKMRQLCKQHDLDGAIFAAGYGRFANLEEFSPVQISRLLAVNSTAPIVATAAIIATLKRKKHSHLIYLGSEAARQGSRKGTIYCASKFALRGFTQALRQECATSGVRVSLVNPGMVHTPFFDQLNFAPQIGTALSTQDIALAICYILGSNVNTSLDEINLSPACKIINFQLQQD